MSSSNATQGVDKQEWSQAERSAKAAVASAGEMASHAASAVGAMARNAVGDVGKEADHLTANAGVCIEELGDRFGKNAPHSGMLGNASQAVAGAVRESGEYLQDAKLTGITADVAHVIRRNPIPSVLIAMGVGWFLGRKLKG